MTDVLLVDDKEENRYLLTALLGGHGYHTRTARNGAEALEMAREAAPDLVISDLLMPVMDGYTLLRHWRSDPALMNVPFIVYTATYTEPEDEKLAFDLGADAFILKPSEPDDLMARVEAVMAREHSRRPAPAQTGQVDGTFKAHNDALIRKLEEKSLQLVQMNHDLQADIECRKRTEAELRRSEADFRALADAMPLIVWVADKDGKVERFNRHWADHMGKGDTPGAGWAAFLHPEDRESQLSNWAHSVATGITYESEIRLRDLDGSYRWWLARAVPIPGDAGHPDRWVGTFTDIHDLKITQESLRQSQRLEALGQLSGGIAHDFNNILQVILVNVEKLASPDAVPQEIGAIVDSISASVDRAGDLIRRLMAFSRNQSLKTEPTDINQLIRSTSTLMRLAVGEAIQLVQVLDDNLHWASVDRSQLESALVNLCVNARDAMPQGGTLTIETRNFHIDAENSNAFPDTAKGDYVQIIVTDTGTGIAPEIMERVFEPFFTTKEEGKGTGLGLSMVYGFVKQSMGHVTLDSTLGKGSTVTLYLKSDPTMSASKQEEATVSKPQSATRVLLVEDNPDVRQSIRMQLERLGHLVTEAKDAAGAIEACAAQAPVFDLVLSDIAMPGGMNGWDLCDVIGARWPSMARILMSGNTQDAARAGGAATRGVLLLPKPFRIRELEQALTAALTTVGRVGEGAGQSGA